MKFREVTIALGANEKKFIGDVDKAWRLDDLSIEIIRVVRDGFIWLQIRKNMGNTVIKSWDLMQEIKNHCLGFNVSAIEVYPKQSKLKNKSQCRHLFVVEELIPPDLNIIYKELAEE